MQCFRCFQREIEQKQPDVSANMALEIPDDIGVAEEGGEMDWSSNVRKVGCCIEYLQQPAFL